MKCFSPFYGFSLGSGKCFQTFRMLRFTPELATDAENFRMQEEEKGLEISTCWAAEA